MTTTTGKRRRRTRASAAPACLPRLAPLALAALLLSGGAHAGAWRFTPIAGVTETYTDNVSLQTAERARGEFVSEARAGFVLATSGPRLKLSASAEGQQFVYSRGGLPNTNDRVLQYRVDANAKLVEDLLFLDAGASSGPQAISAFGPQLNSNLYAMGNRSQVRSWHLSPYLRRSFGGEANLTARYTIDEVNSGTSNLFGNSSGRSASIDLVSGRHWPTLGWGLSASRQELDNELAGKSSSETARGDLSWRLGRWLSLTATGGYDKYDYSTLGGSTAGRNWSAGFIWTPSSRTRLQAAYGRRFFGKTGSLSASHHSRHTVWNLNYSDMLTTSRAQFLLPAAIDTAAMLDRLFSPSMPDPVARQQAVAAYMAATGLPPSLANSVNYFSNRYMRQKTLQGATALAGAHSDLLLSAFATERIALSAQESDSTLLGSSVGTLYDNTRQHGMSALYNYRLSGRTVATLTLNDTHTRSLSAGFADHNQMLRAGLSREFSPKLRGMVELRHVRGGLGAASGQGYRENAVSATLSMQL